MLRTVVFLLWVELVFDPEAVGYGTRVLIEACLESGRSPGQVLGAGVTVMVGHVLT